MLIGEAPGPRGADRSGIPFWGDRAGLPLYLALDAAEMAELPRAATEGWDGQRLRDLDLQPVLRGVALGNAWPVCPTSDGQTFRAPTDGELRQPDNQARLHGEVAQAQELCPGPLRIYALARRAAWTLGPPDLPGILGVLPHPSAQGLLQAAPGRGKGLRLADLQAAWQEDLARRLRQLRAEAQSAR